jgi:NAD(P)-dependent dehydrogenase (short-subunit alcohol dehydrogenase family)
MRHQFLPRAWRRPTDKAIGHSERGVHSGHGTPGPVALVFGGGTGIGRATAVEFAREGATVVVAGRRHAVLAGSIEEIEAAGGRAIGIVADVSRPEDVTRVVTATVAELGRMDAVANCAAIVDRQESMLTGPVELFDLVPLGLVGQPSEAAKAIVWLCSVAASYITGTCVDVDGGLLAS